MRKRNRELLEMLLHLIWPGKENFKFDLKQKTIQKFAQKLHMSWLVLLIKLAYHSMLATPSLLPPHADLRPPDIPSKLLEQGQFMVRKK